MSTARCITAVCFVVYCTITVNWLTMCCNFQFSLFFLITSGQSKLTKKPHRRRTRTVQPMWTPSNTRFLWSTRVHNPNGISIGSVLFAGLAIVTERQTDRQTDQQTTLPRIYVRRTAMRPNKRVTLTKIAHRPMDFTRIGLKICWILEVVDG